MEKHPLHIKIPELQKPEDESGEKSDVQKAVEKQERLEGEKLPNDASVRIEAYMDRLENIFLNPDERVKERNLEMLRPAIYDAFIIKPTEVPESFFELQQRVARERGQAIETISPEMRKQMIETVIEDQKHSLDNWISYLTSEDATYPTWFKYFVFRNIIKLSQFDKSLGKFKERTKDTTAPFPDIYREPLAQVCDVYEKVAEDNKNLKDPEIQKIFSRSFPKVYAEKIQESLAASIENKEGIEGEWIKFEQGNTNHAKKLYDSLQSKGTGWCTAGMSTAETQIKSGDFYVYYTYDKNNEPTQPRIAIRMNGKNEIGEVRGILEHQSLEPQMNDVLEEKLSEFGPESDKYKKKTADMRELTEIEKKTKENIQLSKTELEFLYEINSSIEGFGYQKDPRIEEIRLARNVKEDLPVLFECEPSQIATNQNEVNENTVAYIGAWSVDIYNQIKQYPNIKYLYESFPDKKIFMMTLETDPNINSPETAEVQITEKGMFLSDYAKDILSKTEFSKTPEKYKLVKFTVAELGLKSGATTKEIFDTAKKIGLELCPAEIGPQLRLRYTDQPNGEYLRIAMNPIADRDGTLSVFNVNPDGGERWLNLAYGGPDFTWFDDYGFVFVSRK